MGGQKIRENKNKNVLKEWLVNMDPGLFGKCLKNRLIFVNLTYYSIYKSAALMVHHNFLLFLSN